MAAGAKSNRHNCEWRERAEALEASQAALAQKLEALSHELATLKSRAFGHKSEKLPTAASARAFSGTS